MGTSVEDFDEVALTKRQVEKIRRYMSDDKVLNAAVANALSKKKQSPRARKLANNDNKAVGTSICDLFSHLPLPVRLKLNQIICEKYGFCEHRADYHLVVSVVPVLVAATMPYIAVPVCIWVILLKNRALELFCECEPGKKSEFLQKLIARLFKIH